MYISKSNRLLSNAMHSRNYGCTAPISISLFSFFNPTPSVAQALPPANCHSPPNIVVCLIVLTVWNQSNINRPGQACRKPQTLVFQVSASYGKSQTLLFQGFRIIRKVPNTTVQGFRIMRKVPNIRVPNFSAFLHR